MTTLYPLPSGGLSLPPYPAADPAREARIVAQVCELMHEPKPAQLLFDALESAPAPAVAPAYTHATQRRVARWVASVGNKAKGFRPWWFLRARIAGTVPAGADMLDLGFDFDRPGALWCPGRLEQRALSSLIEWRALAALHSRPNGGRPTHYALEAGRRIHLWPAPDAEYPLRGVCQRVFSIALCPDEWEAILVDGVLGFYGHLFDRDALATINPADMQARFWDGLRRANIENHDAASFKTYDDGGGAVYAVVDSNSDADIALEIG